MFLWQQPLMDKKTVVVACIVYSCDHFELPQRFQDCSWQHKKLTKGLLCQGFCSVFHSVLKCPFVKFMAVSFWLAQSGNFQSNFTVQYSSVSSGAKVIRVHTSSFFLSNKLLLCHFSSHKTQFELSKFWNRARKSHIPNS